MKGWIKLHRRIKENWLYQEKRTFSRFEAWVDLLLEANHKDNKFPLGNEIVECKRGQLITSVRQLCDRWRWSNTKVTNFLKLLQNDNMITYFSDTKKTVITIVNYELYQSEDDTITTNERHDNDARTTRKHTNKNDKNDKNERSTTTVDPVKFFVENFGDHNLTHIQMIESYMDDMQSELIIKAMEIAIENDKRFFNYLKGILNNWLKKGIKSIEQYELANKERKFRRERQVVDFPRRAPDAEETRRMLDELLEG